MEVKVINSKTQEYNGIRYYLSGRYFSREGKRLHRKVWTDHYGPIPEGMHVHHKDGNKSNNDISNLELLTAHDHMSHHSTSPEARNHQKKQIKLMQDLAAEWHSSEEGRAWHSEHAKQQWKKMEPIKYVCSCCGKEFESVNRYSKESNRFCSNNCKAKFRRDSGVDNVTVACKRCGKLFIKNKYGRQKFCSRSCSTKYWRENESKES